jgi:hypothetical protein
MAMRVPLPALLAATLAGLLSGAAGGAAGQSTPAAEDEKVLAAAGIEVDGPSLLEFFRKRTLSREDQERLSATVRRLGDRAYRRRAKASADLVAAGRLAVSHLKAALRDPDLEIARRAELCLARIEQGKDVDLATAAARLVKRRKPAGAAEVLINYLAFANDDSLIEAVQDALNAVAAPDGKPAVALVRALKDRLPARRGAAAEALTRAGPAEIRQVTGKLLNDADAAVRLQVALAFVDVRDKRGVPVLIASLADLPHDKAWQAEEVLVRLAGEESPKEALGGNVPPARVRDAWKGWWAKRSTELDLAKLGAVPRVLGYTLITQLDTINHKGGGLNGRVLEIGRDSKPRWTIENVRYPLDAHLVGRDRVLVAEYLDRRVTERTLKGDIVWQVQVNNPIGCQRLPNGNTFIVTRNQLLEVDAKGNQTVLYNQRNFTISGAKKARNGDVYVVASTGQLSRLDRTGKEVKTFQVGQMYFFGGIELLPAGRVLVAEYRNNRVAEYDAQGKLVWQAQANFPTSAVRLPNGHTLVTIMINQQIVELNRDGKVVWQHHVADGRPFRARRR